MLLSIHLNSNRPHCLKELVKNIENTAAKPQEIEIIVNIDKEDTLSKNTLNSLKNSTKVKIKYIQTDIIKSFKDVWKPYNQLLELTDKNAEFITLFSDEFRFETKNWDNILRKYINYYEDGIFRIRLSRYRVRNYNDFWECIFSPDSLAIFTKKWVDTVGQWCPCTGPDSWQQLVAFYLTNSRKFDHIQYNRDIADNFITFSGEGASVGLTGLKARQRIKDNVDLWFETVSHEMQEKAKYAAAKLQTAIIMYDNSYNKEKITHNFRSNQKPPMFDGKNFKEINYKNNEKEKRIEFYHQNNLIYKISYKLNKLKLFVINNIRKPNYGYYAGGGEETFHLNPINTIITYLHIRKYGNFKYIEILFTKLLLIFFLKITFSEKYYRFIRLKIYKRK